MSARAWRWCRTIDFHFCFVVTRTDQPVIRLIKRAAGVEEILAEQPIAAGRCYLKVEAHEQAYNFYAAAEPDQWQPVAEGVDGRILSTPVAGGFVGAVIALYASSNGQASTNRADFDWFEYVGLDEAGIRRRCDFTDWNTLLVQTMNEPTATPQNPIYLDPSRSFEERVNDLVGRMTVEEKVSQMGSVAPAIERLGIPQYNWWNEGLHGVARAGLATVFPQGIGLASTWNTDLIYRMATGDFGRRPRQAS